MRIFLSGGSGVLGRSLIPLLAEAGHDIRAPGRADLDLYDAKAVRRALDGAEALYHLATRIPTREAQSQPGAWAENDRLRSEASKVIVDAALAAGVTTFVLPSVTFVYPAEETADEETPVTPAANLGSMMEAERQCRRFVEAGRRGVVLRLGLLWGPDTGNDAAVERYGSTLHIADSGSALAAALTLPSGVYNVTADGERVSNARFKAASGWRPVH